MKAKKERAEYRAVRIHPQTYAALRKLAFESGDTLVETLDKAVEALKNANRG